MINKILITGAAGLIGSNLAHYFVKQKKLVIGLDNFIGGYKSNYPISSYFTHYNVDITNRQKVNDVVVKYKPDLIIHCAALAHEGLSVFSPSIIANNIYSGTVSVATAAIANNVKYFINTSSMARYGEGDPPFKETDVPIPVDPYGQAKLQAEELLNLLSDIHKIKVFHLVPHNVGGIGQCYSDPYRNVISIFANKIIHNEPIYIYGDGNQKRSFSHIDDCVLAFDNLVKGVTRINNKSVFNIGPTDGTEITINYLAELVYKQFSIKPNIIYVPDRPREVRSAWVDTTKAQKLLHYKTTKSTEDVVKDTVDWIKKSPKRSFNYHLDLEIINETTPKTWVSKLI